LEIDSFIEVKIMRNLETTTIVISKGLAEYIKAKKKYSQESINKTLERLLLVYREEEKFAPLDAFERLKSKVEQMETVLLKVLEPKK